MWIYLLILLAFILAIFQILGPCGFLLSGMSIALIFGNPQAKKTAKLGKYLLQLAVILMGFKFDFSTVLSVGSQSIFVSLITISLILTCGWLLAKLLKVETGISTLISCGTAICGGSAIAAIGSSLKSNEKDMAMALGVIFLLNAVALLIFPILGHTLQLDGTIFGYWSGIAIQDTSSVVGAAHAYGNGAEIIAVPVKLSRALWIIPLSFAVLWNHNRCHKNDISQKKSSFSIPWFIFLFLAASACKYALPSGEFIYSKLAYISDIVLIFTLFLIGLGMSRKALKHVGWRALVLGILLWFIIATSSLTWLYFYPPIH